MHSILFALSLFVLTASDAFAQTSQSLDLQGHVCVSVISVGRERVGDGIKVKYVISNICDKGFSIELETLNGWTAYSSIGPHQKSEWFCTDGYRGQKDCGGVKGFVAK